MPGGWPRKSLLERVVERSFRPSRYGELLDAPPLPPEPPSELVRRSPFAGEYLAALWTELSDLQWW